MYTLLDLNKQVNEDETLLEFIRNSEKAFEMEVKALEIMSNTELNNYINFLDYLWEK